MPYYKFPPLTESRQEENYTDVSKKKGGKPKGNGYKKGDAGFDMDEKKKG
jgi:hypothetical protein